MQPIDGAIKVESIVAGKLRRYHKLSIIRQMLQVRTIVLPNIIDFFKLLAGFIQSVIKLVVWRPDVVFSKGGFVCLPVGLAATLLRIPLVIHDSDAHPGLTSRILSRWATTIATGAPLKFYSYPKERSHYIGIPVMSPPKPVSQARQRREKESFGFSQHEPLVVVTGGGLGAAALNEAVIETLDDLLSFTAVALVAGKANQETLAAQVKRHRNIRVYGYLPPQEMQRLLSAADIVVSRAGATTLLELAALGKPSVIIPNENLTGGHQIKNAAVYAKAKAIIVLENARIETNPRALTSTLDTTLLNATLTRRLSTNIRSFAKPDAAKDMARLIVEAIK